MLAKNVNDNAACRVARGACAFFASKLAPTGKQGFSGRFYGLFFRLAIEYPYMHLKNKQMKK
ncbi:hypothetical protein [Pseudomonas sp. HY7a-MNA-CIBAN-0227]|uniref:hypothetical protein n=1 Tax=Pseudomonas sp. HY7a-MNA-CIBAN-0227 TaxID=3140474 RepID=UPI00331D564E